MSDEESQKVEEENQESESDDDVDPLSAEEISRHEKCTRLDFEIYDDYQHIKFNAPNILGSIGKFCAAFYHVPSKNDNPQYCLDDHNCKVGQEDTLPRSVVALVKYEIDDGNDIIVRYSNHYMQNATKHAEEFFSDDIKNLTSSSSVSRKTLKKITMYVTFQPCHFSAKYTHDKNCCGVLLELLDHPRLNGVKICIKPTHIYIAGKTHPDLVRKGKEGISLLMDRGIEITRMEENDWNDLFNLVDMVDTKREQILSGYSGSRRKDLDEKIGGFLGKIQPSPSNTDDLNLLVDYLHITGPSGGGCA